MKKQTLYKNRNKPSGRGIRLVLRSRQRVLQRLDFIAIGIFIIAASAGLVIYLLFAKPDSARAKNQFLPNLPAKEGVGK